MHSWTMLHNVMMMGMEKLHTNSNTYILNIIILRKKSYYLSFSVRKKILTVLTQTDKRDFIPFYARLTAAIPLWRMKSLLGNSSIKYCIK